MPALSKEEIFRLVDAHRMSPDNKRIVLFGAGKIGHTALKYCEREGIRLFCIIDNNSQLWGQTIGGVQVFSPEGIAEQEPSLIILAGDRSAEMAAQLEGYGLHNYISYFLFQYRYSAGQALNPGSTSVECACNWILQNQQKNGGVSVFCGSQYEYPEVTGYIIPTMLQYGFRDEALAMARYLASVTNPDGSFTAAGSDRVYLFDTAQALRGLNAICEITDEYAGLREKTAEYLFSVLRDHDGIFPYSYADDPIIPETIMLFALPPMLEYAHLTGSSEKAALIRRSVERYLEEPDVLSPETLTHFLAYQIDGLIDMGCTDEVKPVIESLLASQREDGSIPAYAGVDWVCITGCSQIAICLYKLEMPEPADRLMAWVERNMEPGGGFLGSVGPGAAYFWDREPSWAVKFYLDAYKRMISAHFDYKFASGAPEEIASDDAEVLSITDELQGCEQVLEVGCGKGRILKRIHERFPLCCLKGVDISKAMLSYVPDYVETLVGDIEFLPYGDNQFDVVYTVECIEHSVNLCAAVRELVRVCKPGGKVIIIDKQLSNWSRMATPPWERWPDRALLEEMLRRYCGDVQSRPVCLAGYDERDDMFIEWRAVK